MPGTSRTPDGTYPTTCWECSTCCGALATVRGGRVIDFAPNRGHPYSKGAFCLKGIRGAPGLTYNPNRLLYPIGAPARAARAAGRASHGTRRLTRWRTGSPRCGTPRPGGDRRRDQRRLFQPQRDPGPDVALDRLAQLDDQPGSVRGLPGGVGENHRARHHARRGHRACALRAHRRAQLAAADPIEWAALKAAKKRGARLIVIDPKRTRPPRSPTSGCAAHRHRRGAGARDDAGADREGRYDRDFR